MMRLVRGLVIGMAIGLVVVMVTRVGAPPVGAFHGAWTGSDPGMWWGWSREVLRGSGNVQTETRQVSGFERVRLHDVGTVVITQGTQEGLTIEAEDNFLPKLRAQVNGKTLELGPEPGVRLQNTKPIRYLLTVKELSELQLAGSGRIEATTLKSDRLELKIGGSGKIVLGTVTAERLEIDLAGSGETAIDQLTVGELNVKIAGSGNVNVGAGKAKEQDVLIMGSGDYRADRLETKTAELKLLGSGDAHIWATDTLKVETMGSGTVEYKGNPRLDHDGHGSGKVRRSGP